MREKLTVAICLDIVLVVWLFTNRDDDDPDINLG